MDLPPAQTVEPVIRVDKLSVRYFSEQHQAVCALHQATLEIRSGELIGILGESGSGKSTLAQAVLRLLPANAQYEHGLIQFRGRDLLALQERDLRNIRGTGVALISQDPASALNPVMAVGDQIADVIRSHIPMSGADRRIRVEALLSEVGFQQPRQIYRAYPHQLSGGQRQRIVIAQAMACTPTLIIADEPTSKLDASLQSEILTLMRDISVRHGTAFVLISHNPAVLAGFANRIVVMYAGRIVEEGRTADVFRRPLHPYTQALMRLTSRYLPNPAPRERFQAIEGEPPHSDSCLPGCAFAPRCADRMQVCMECDPRETAPNPSQRVSCFKYGE